MTASDYPVTFPFGATTDPYSVTHPHRGDDRPCPVGTPIAIGGTIIGLTGATGKVTGAHLHIQEWQGDPSNVRKPQNAFVGGTVVNIDPEGTQGDGSFGKFITIQTADGWNDSYCHLSQINVTVGQVIGGQPPGGMLMVDKNMLNNLYKAVFDRAPDPAADGWLGQPADVVLQHLLESPEYAQRVKTLTDRATKLAEDEQTIADLHKQLSSPPVKPSDPNSVVVTQTGLWAAFKRFLGL